MKKSEALMDLIYRKGVPDHLLRHFAANVAEDAFLRVHAQMDPASLQPYLQALEAARRFAEGEAGPNELLRARQELAGHISMRWFTRSHLKRDHASSSVYYCCLSHAQEAADLASTEAAMDHGMTIDIQPGDPLLARSEREEEMFGQHLQRLQSMMKEYEAKRRGLVSVLRRRDISLFQALCVFKQEAGEALFSVD